MAIRLHALALVLVFAVGCAHRSQPLIPDVVIPLSALTDDVVFHGCEDVTTSPPTGCKKILIKYRKGAEQIKVGNTTTPLDGLQMEAAK